jgi:hypothetical protein
VGTGEARLGTAVAPGAESEAVVPQPAAIKSGQESSRTVSKLRAPVPLAERLPTLCGLKAGTARMGDPCRSDGSGTSWV